MNKNITNETIVRETIRELKENLTEEEKTAMFEYAVIVANAFMSDNVGEESIQNISEATEVLKTKNIVEIVNSINTLIEMNFNKQINTDIVIDHEEGLIKVNNKDIPLES